jgi:hypothetical protein
MRACPPVREHAVLQARMRLRSHPWTWRSFRGGEMRRPSTQRGGTAELMAVRGNWSRSIRNRTASSAMDTRAIRLAPLADAARCGTRWRHPGARGTPLRRAWRSGTASIGYRSNAPDRRPDHGTISVGTAACHPRRRLRQPHIPRDCPRPDTSTVLSSIGAARRFPKPRVGSPTSKA